MSEKKHGLGRGLNELLSPADWLKTSDIQLFYCPLDRLVPNPYQPRQMVRDAAMDDLVQSIREKGILQPILVAHTSEKDRYQIVAGERRWRAAILAGLTEAPVLLRDSTPAEALEIAIVENIQRQDLNCIEEALAYQRLQEEFHLTHQQIADRVGKNRSTVANLIRLLQLPQDIQEKVLNQEISMGHARALLSVTDTDFRRKLCDRIVARQLSVRQTEELAARGPAVPPPKAPEDDRAILLRKSLQDRLGGQVRLTRQGERRKIIISFRSDAEFQSLLERLGLHS